MTRFSSSPLPIPTYHYLCLYYCTSLHTNLYAFLNLFFLVAHSWPVISTILPFCVTTQLTPNEFSKQRKNRNRAWGFKACLPTYYYILGRYNLGISLHCKRLSGDEYCKVYSTTLPSRMNFLNLRKLQGASSLETFLILLIKYSRKLRLI